MNLVGYVRVSTEEQARDGVSLKQQVERLNAYCALHGHTLVSVYKDEGVSASVALGKRKAGRQVLIRLQESGVDGVAVVRLDRLFRDALDGLTFFRHADRVHAAVHSVSELIDSSTPAGKLSLTLQLAAAQYERDLAVQRATECNTALREQGKVYGHVPYGCVAVGEDGDRRLQRDRNAWHVRDSIIDMLKAGRSLRAIRSELAAADIPSPTGKRQWSLNTLRELRTHHDSLASLPMADGGHDAMPAAGTPDPEVSPYV